MKNKIKKLITTIISTCMLTATLQAQATDTESYHRFSVESDNYENWVTVLDVVTELKLDFNHVDANDGYYKAQMAFQFQNFDMDRMIEIRTRYEEKSDHVVIYVRYEIDGEQQEKLMLPYTVKLGEHLLVDTKLTRNKITFTIDGTDHSYPLKFKPELIAYMCVGCVGEMGITY